MIYRFSNEMSHKRIMLSLLAFLFFVACGKVDFSDTERVSRAKNHQASGDYKASLIELKNALQQNPKNSDARLLLGELYVKVGNGEAAEKELNRAIELGIVGHYVQKLLMEALLLQHRFEDVAKILKEMDVDSQADLLVLRGQTELGMGDSVRATASFKQAVSIDSDENSGQLWLARMELGNGDHQSAEARVEKVLTKAPDNAEPWLVKGNIATQQKNNEIALAAFQRSIDLSPTTMPTFIGMAAQSGLTRLLIQEKKFDKAEEHVTYLLKVAPRFPIPNYLAALLAYEQKQYDKAKDYLQIVMKLTPNDLSSILLLGSTNYILGHYEQASTQLTKVISERPGFMAARMLLASLRLRQNQAGDALKALEPALVKAPNDVRLLAMIGQASLQSGEYKKGRRILQKAIAKSPENNSLRTQLAMLFMSEGNDELAILELKKAIASGSGTEVKKERALLALTYVRQKKFDDALAIANVLAMESPDEAYPQNFLGLIYLEMGKIIEARNAFSASLKINPDYFPASLNLARFDINDGKLNDARLRLESILAKDEKNVSAMIALAQVAIQRKDHSQAIGWLERAREGDAVAVVPRLILAKYYANGGKTKQALDVVRETKGLVGDDSRALDVIARVEMVAKEYSAAIVTLKKLAKLEPNPEVYFWLAISHLKNNNTPAAQLALKETIRLNPNHLKGQTLLAVIDLEAGRTRFAMQKARQIKQNNSKSPMGYELEGDIFVSLKQDSQAIKAYGEAILRGGGSGTVLKNAAVIRRKQGDKAAIKFLEKWLTENPDIDKPRYVLAALYASLSQFKNAIDEYRILLSNNPNDIRALNDIAWLLHQDNQTTEALEFAEKAYQIAPENGVVLDTFGWITYMQGNVKAALGYLRQAAEKQKSSKEVQYHYVAVLAASGKQDEQVREMLEDILSGNPTFPEKAEAQQLLESLKGK